MANKIQLFTLAHASAVFLLFSETKRGKSEKVDFLPFPSPYFSRERDPNVATAPLSFTYRWRISLQVEKNARRRCVLDLLRPVRREEEKRRREKVDVVSSER